MKSISMTSSRCLFKSEYYEQSIVTKCDVILIKPFLLLISWGIQSKNSWKKVKILLRKTKSFAREISVLYFHGLSKIAYLTQNIKTHHFNESPLRSRGNLIKEISS